MLDAWGLIHKQFNQRVKQGFATFFSVMNNGHVRPPDTTKHESLGSSKHKDFHINTHGYGHNEQ